MPAGYGPIAATNKIEVPDRMKSKSIIIYYTQTGNTKKIADAIYAGISKRTGQCDIRHLKDIDAAKDLPQSTGGYTAGDDLLLIEQTKSMIHYQRKDNYIYRYEFKDGKQIPEKTRYWLLPDTKITWRVRRRDGKGYAVEIRHHNEYILHGHLIKKMENSNLFFVGILE